MKNFTSRLRAFVLLAAVLVASAASAQFKATVEQMIRTDYACQNAEFSLTAVAQAVGTDTATLCRAVEAFLPDSLEDTHLFGILNADGTFCDGYNCDGRGSYWLNMDGTLGQWGDNAVYNSLIEVNPEADLFAIPVGHHPNAVTDSVATLHFVLNFNNQQATFDVAYTILPLPEAPAPASLLVQEQNIVGTQKLDVERSTMQGYEATKLSFEAQPIADALGTTPELLGNYLSQIVYMQPCNTEYELVDTLSNNYTAGAPGFWMRRSLYPVGHEQAGDESPILGAFDYSEQDKMFIEAFAYDAETNTITANLGQFPGKTADGEDLIADLYLILGDKTYKLTVETRFTQPEAQNISEMTEVGTTTYSVEQEPTNNYATVAFSVDIASIAQALGCETSEVTLKVPANDNEFWAGSTTADPNGYYFTRQGVVCNWDGDASTSAFFITPAAIDDYSSFNIGQHGNAKYQPGDSCVTDLYFVNGVKYYRGHVVLTITEKQIESTDEWQLMGQRVLTVQQTANDGYVWSDQTAIIKADDLVGLIGTATPTLYGEECDTLGNVTKTKVYTCDPNPGFWLTADGYVANWGNNTTWGITTEGQATQAGTDYGFKCMQFPGSGVVGNAWTGNFYLLNPETNHYVKVILTNRVVETVTETESAGEMDVMVPITIEGTEVPFPWQTIADSLHCTIDDLSNTNCMRGTTGSGVNITTGLQFNADGSISSSDTGAFTFVYEGDESIWAFSSLEEEVADDWKALSTVYFEYEGRQFTVHVTFCSAAIYTPVTGIKADTQTVRTYDLQGRQVVPAQRGIYIRDGRKVVIR